MVSIDLTTWRKHIDQVVHDEGQWVGILDGDGNPLYEIPSIVSVSLPEARLATSSLECVANVAADDRIVADLIGDGLGQQDLEGRLLPNTGPARLFMLQRAGGERRVAFITHVSGSGLNGPTQLTIKGTDLFDNLGWWPCPSIPVEWTKARFSGWDTDASGGKYSKTRQLAQVQFASNADGYTKKGRAVTVVSQLMVESFEAVNRLYGWGGDPGIVVADPGGEDLSPEVLIRVNDDPLWDTVAEPCRNSGLGVEVSLWWPGDTPVDVLGFDGFDGSDGSTRFSVVKAKSWAYPVQVVRVYQVEEV